MSKQFVSKIKEIRTWLGLNQAQFSSLLGLSVASLNRYENGAIPTNAHKSLLQLISDPIALLKIIQDKEKVLGLETYRRVSDLITSASKSGEFKRLFSYDTPEEKLQFTGNQKFDAEKLKQLILFFTANGEWKTKLNKLLFYSDFLAYKISNQSITGIKYVVGNYGPIPDDHEFLYAALLQCKALENREEFKNAADEPVEKLYSREVVELGIFSKQEIEIIKFILNTFKSFSAKRIADYSHEEDAWKLNSLGNAIPYSFASKIRLNIKNKEPESLWMAIQEAMQEYKTDLNKLPSDSAKNLDHYLYGSPKK